MKSFLIKISTGENAPVNSFKDVMHVLSIRNKMLRHKKKYNTIPLKVDGGIAHIYPEFIIGWAEIEGSSLQDIVSQQEELVCNSAELDLPDIVSHILQESSIDATID